MRLRLIALGGLAFGMPALVWLAFALASSPEGATGEPETIHIGARWRTDDAKDLQTLLASSDTVFVGTVSALRGQRSEDLTPNDTHRGAAGDALKPPADRQTSLPISLFDVRVDDVWKGDLDGGSVITIEQAGGTVQSSHGETTRLVLEGDRLMDIGQTYLFLSGPASDGVTFVTTPFKRLALDGSGRFAPLAGWGHLGALQQIAGLTPDDLRRVIAEAAQ